MKPLLDRLLGHIEGGQKLTLSRVPDGFDALILSDLTRALARQGSERPATLVMVARDAQRQAQLEAGMAFVAPDLEVLTFPNWDCQPYDRVSPNGAIVARRMTVLSRLARSKAGADKPRLLIVTANGLVQRVPRRDKMAAETFSCAPGNMIDIQALAVWLEHHGYLRGPTVRETGEYAVRGGIVDLFPPGLPNPIRLDFFGDTLESIRSFDPETQRSVGQMRALDLVPMSEVQLTSETIKRFRQAYVAQFGAATPADTLYEAISEGRRYAGLEHWLPLFHDGLDTLFDYIADSPLVLDPLVQEAGLERISSINDHYDARFAAMTTPQAGATPYKAMPPLSLYLDKAQWTERLGAQSDVSIIRLEPFAHPESSERLVVDAGGKLSRSFAPERKRAEAGEDVNIFDVVADHIREIGSQRRVIVATWSEGARERISGVLHDHGLQSLKSVSRFNEVAGLKAGDTATAVWGLESGFETDGLVVISEQDILGDRLVRRAKRNRRAQDVIAEVGALTPGDLVVHVEHGIGRFVGLKNIEAAGAPHDCVELHYAGGDRLFLPVENLELLSRYGSEDSDASLDRLGGGAWQARKAKMKQRIREMAHALIKIAAARALNEAPKLIPAEGLYEEFAARFAYDETEDQQRAIDAVLDDLASGHPMDRLVCGDVGFGKTEVALRAAFVAAISGRQVALVVPTTLLARQHYRNFAERFKGLPIVVRQASRFVPAKELAETKLGLADGTVDIVIGTHALLSKTIAFRDLALLIIDEEQHFGVNHKERLKEMRAAVHVLTLSATPIPRTLQLALTGVRELSMIATPPVDRLAVRSFVTPFDPLIIREALLRERYRGGQSFYVCPRIEDIQEARDFLAREVPEAKVAVAHGQMPATELESIMTGFYEGQYDVLLSTAIVESGLDIPSANTLIVHRADMFGLAQLYQLRGRVGRGKIRAYALFTVPASKPVTDQAEKRLKVLQSLDGLGAGFMLASHDLDLRGAGNLLGDEQSGHIKEVGYELYQKMLEEAVAALKAGVGDDEDIGETQWSPSITIGTPVMIPEHYVGDLTLRLGLYKRLSTMHDHAALEGFAAEMVDRFGPLPDEVEQLFALVRIKAQCRRANIDKLEAGPRGIILSFRDNSFAQPEGLMRYIQQQGSLAKVRPDMRIVFIDDFPKPSQRLKGAGRILKDLVKIAESGKAGA
jgi:transcription-repair coupling factor (superfamily II helicase)